MADQHSGHQGNVKDPEHDGRLKENREAGRTKGTTEASRERAETGGHATQEDQHAKGHQPSGKSSAGESHAHQAGSEDGDLKSREYTDADGNVHHHTRAYQEQHGGETK